MGVAAVRLLTLFSVCLLSTISPAQTPAHILITKPVDESQLTVLKGNTHPFARAEFDQGAAPPDLPMNRMLLVLKRSDEQENALRSLIDNQQDKSSPNYHKWLTPDAFGKQFGPSDQDIQQVTSWLQSHGFQIAQVSKGRTVIEFSGTAAQVQEALHTSIHKYVVKGEEHWANSSDPKIPAALTPVVGGVLTLHNFLKKPLIHMLDQRITARYVPGSKPQFTSSSGLHALTPSDYDIIYNVPSQPAAGGVARIAIVGRSNINLGDIQEFHNVMGLQGPVARVLVNGPDPGDLGGGEEAEAVLDATWSNAVAPDAFVTLVVSASTNSTDGVDLSEFYIIDNNLADVMSESFGGCEANATSADASAISSLAQQAAAEGITYMVSTGDSGAAGCDDPNSEASATGPLSVNILASSPYTVAVGGTMFNENGQDSTYWSASNSQFTLESALSYIPEKVWNESCAGTQCGASQPNIWAGSGGASIFFQKPPWQAGFGDMARDLPDVSLTAAGHDPYLLCLQGSCTPDSQGFIHFFGISGTSASAPAFAGIMARVGEKTGSRQGQADYVLYKLAANETFSQCNGSKPGGFQVNTCPFDDVTLGNNSVPGDADYGITSAKYQSSTGYDLATGLGSVNVSNLLNAWDTAVFNATTTTALINPLAAIHGSAINVTVQVTSNSGKPTGSIWLVGGGYSTGNLIGDDTQVVLDLDTSGSVNAVTHVLSGGSYSLIAHYIGDGTYAPSDSAPVMLNIQPEQTITSLSLFITDQNGNLIPYTGGPIGTPISMKVQVSGISGYGNLRNGSVDFSDGMQYIGSANLDQSGAGILPPSSNFSVGSHSITGQFRGTPSFNTSLSSAVPFTVVQASTSTSLIAAPAFQGVTLTAIVSTNPPLGGPSGSVTFYSGNTVLGNSPVSEIIMQNGTLVTGANFSDTQLPNGQYSMTATYNGDSNYLASTSPPVNVSLQTDFSIDHPSPSPITVTAGQSAFFGFAVTFYGSFSGAVTFSCSGLPSEAACSAPPMNSPGGATLTVTTKAHTAAALRMPGSPRLGPWASTLGVLAGMLFLGRGSKTRRSSAFCSFFMAVLLTIGIGCGGGASNTGGSSSPQVDPGTPAGTYSIIMTAVSGNLSHTAKFTLVVQ